MRWAEYLKNLLNVVEDREAEKVAVGGVQAPMMEVENESEITKEEEERALRAKKQSQVKHRE